MKPVRRGFTLIELLVVIAIVAILAAILLPILVNAKRASLSSVCQSNLKQIGKAIAMYCSDSGGIIPFATDDLFGNQFGDGGSGGGDFSKFREGTGNNRAPYIWNHQGLAQYYKDKKIFACLGDFGGVWGGNITYEPSMHSDIGGSYEYNIYILLDRKVTGGGGLRAYNPDGTNLLAPLTLDEVGEPNMVPVMHDARDTWHDLSSPKNYAIREARDGVWNVLYADMHVKQVIAKELRPNGNNGARRSDYTACWWWRGGLRGSPRIKEVDR